MRETLLAFSFASLLAGCGEAPALSDGPPARRVERFELIDEGAVCVRTEDEGRLSVTVSALGCYPSYCNTLVAASCQLELVENEIVVRSSMALDQQTSAEICPADCQSLTTECTPLALPAGDYTLRLGTHTAALLLPTPPEQLFDAAGVATTRCE